MTVLDIRYKNPEKEIAAAKQRFISNMHIEFPMEDRPHYMLLEFYEYQRVDPEVNRNPNPDQRLQSIALPLPTQLVDQYGMRYSGADFGITGAMGLATAGGIDKIFEKIGTPEGVTMKDLEPYGEGVSAGGIARALARRISSIDAGISGAIDRITGKVLNPHAITVFEGMNLRQHQFSWKVYPQSAEESYRMRKVLGTIRKDILPRSLIDGAQDMFLINYPNEVFITIFTENKPLIKIGRSVIQNFSINYAPQGVPAFFKGTHDPIEIEFSMDVMEVATLTRESVESLDDLPNRSDTVSDQMGSS